MVQASTVKLLGRTYPKRTTVTYHSFTVQAYVTQRLELGKNDVTVAQFLGAEYFWALCMKQPRSQPQKLWSFGHPDLSALRLRPSFHFIHVAA